jgi:hypothetical protein
MTLTDKQKEAIERIRKVIALATNKGATEGEADNASATVIRLLATHNLTMEDVNAGKHGDIITDGEITSDTDDWRCFLAASTARLYFCEYFAEPLVPDDGLADGPMSPERLAAWVRVQYRHCFSGREHNVVVAKEMFRYFVATVEELARKARAKHHKEAHALDDVRAQERQRKEGRKFEQAFRFGCAKRLAHRIDEKWFDLSRSPETQLLAGNKLPALYLQNDAEVSAYVEENFGKELMVKEPTLPSNFEGLFRGFVAGKNVGLDTQVEKNETKKIT